MYDETRSLIQRAPDYGPGAAEISIREIFDLVLSGRWTLLMALLLGVTIGVALCVLLPPKFSSSGVVQIDDVSKSSISADAFGTIPGILSGAILESAGELEILRTRLVLDPVIEKMNLEIVAVADHFPIIGAAIARFNSGTNAPVSVPAPLRGWAWGGESIRVDEFKVPYGLLGDTLSLTVTQDGFALSGDWGDTLLQGRVGERASSEDGSVSILVGALRAAPGTEFNVTRLSHDDTVSGLLEQLAISELGTSSGVIGITFSGSDRQRVADVVNNLQASYLQQNVERHSLDAQRSLDFLERQLPELRREMLEAQQQLSQYQQRHAVPDVASETQILLESATSLETRRLGLTTDLDRASQQFTPQHPTVIALRQQLESVRREQDRLKQRIGGLPPTQQEVLNLTRDVQAYSQLYNAILASIQNFQVAKAGTIGNVRIVDAATPPFKRDFPKPRSVLPISIALSLMLAVIWIFLRRGLLRGVDHPGILERRFARPTVALIPYSNQQRRIGRFLKSTDHSHLLAETHSSDPAIEAIRSLRTSMEFAVGDAPNNRLMICGPAPSIGKTFLSANLAAVLAGAGRRVMILDADLRRGTLHGYFGVEVGIGLSELLQNECDVERVIRHSTIPGLDFITRGHHARNPSELLLKPAFAEQLKLLGERYDVVLVDTPPVLAVTDAAIVGRLVGTTILVLKSAQHRLAEIEESIQRLANANIAVRGFVLNQIGAEAGSYGYRGYGYAHYDYQS